MPESGAQHGPPGDDLRAELGLLRAKLEAARVEVEQVRGELEAVRTELEARRAEAERNWDQFLRARADLDNYRRRMEREVERLVDRGRQELLLRFLEVADNFQRALMPQVMAAADPDGLRRGLELISRQLDNLLGQEGVQPLEAVGAPFDPRLHEAVAAWECDDVDRETVTDEIQKGYLYRGEVLRPARVRVARPPEPGDGA
ncbi:MAG: nucleotide exchange factor GrpE [Bacillota bacterium]